MCLRRRKHSVTGCFLEMQRPLMWLDVGLSDSPPMAR